MANELHTMPLKLERLFSSSRFRMLKWDEKGAYLLLLAEVWLMQCRCNADAKHMQRLLGVHEQDWERIKTNVVDEFFPLDESGEFRANPHQLEIWEEVQAKRGKRVAAARKRWMHSSCNADAKQMQSNADKNQNQSQSQSIKENIKRKKFTPPTIDEVAAYCEERGNAVDPQRWRDHYESNGWKVGRNPMKDWKAAVRTWERNEKSAGSSAKYPTAADYESMRNSNLDEL
jgi:uncharacterized protein YdaU (DUF1376 family)